MRRFSAIAAFILATGLVVAVHAEDIWKWVDAQGEVHYSDRPVPGAVLVKGHDDASDDASSQPADDGKKSSTSTDQISAELSKEAAARKVQQDEAAAHAEQCKAAQDNYQKLIQTRRLYTTDSNGDREYLSDEQADQQRVQARIDMDNACGSNTQ